MMNMKYSHVAEYAFHRGTVGEGSKYILDSQGKPQKQDDLSQVGEEEGIFRVFPVGGERRTHGKTPTKFLLRCSYAIEKNFFKLHIFFCFKMILAFVRKAGAKVKKKGGGI